MNGIEGRRLISNKNVSVLVYCLGAFVLMALSIGYSFSASKVSGSVRNQVALGYRALSSVLAQPQLDAMAEAEHNIPDWTE